MKNPLGNKGVTLLELMTVVAIIGLTAALAIPAYLKMQPHLRLKTASRDIASTLQSARMTAIAKNASQTVNLSLTNDSCAYATTLTWPDIDLYPETGAMLNNVVDGVSYTYPPFTGNAVTFKSDGTTTIPDTEQGEGVYIRNKNNPAEKFRVLVDARTGIITVQNWSVSQWEE